MNISGIFSSIQGEGPYAGYRQIFIRFSGCHLSCDYCDENTTEGKILTDEEALKEVNNLNKSFHHSISLTGGEPLLQVDEIKKLIPKLPLPIYLETSATLPDYLKEIYKNISI
jgi:organic radical activating enzyme